MNKVNRNKNLIIRMTEEDMLKLELLKKKMGKPISKIVRNVIDKLLNTVDEKEIEELSFDLSLDEITKLMKIAIAKSLKREMTE